MTTGMVIAKDFLMKRDFGGFFLSQKSEKLIALSNLLIKVCSDDFILLLHNIKLQAKKTKPTHLNQI